MQEASEQPSYMCGVALTPVEADTLDPEERACYICFQSFGFAISNRGEPELPVQLPCGHVFGVTCISTWTLLNDSCPLCRRKVLDINDCPVSRPGLDSSSPNSSSSSLTAQEDIWLDEEVWNSTSGSSEEAVSDSDIDALIDFYTRDLSNVNFDNRPQSYLQPSICSEHRGSCHCCDDGDPGNEVLPHRRLPPLATANPESLDIDNVDLMEMGAQFAELSY